MPIAVTAQKAARHPARRPSQAPKGTPSKVATVSPMNMVAIAEARRSDATSPLATTDPTPKKVPCASEVRSLAAISAVIARRERAGGVAEREDRHQHQERRLPRHAPRREGEDRRADEDAERVARDQESGGRHRDMHVRGDLQQQPHDDEFGRADAEGTGGQGENGDGHGWLLRIADRPEMVPRAKLN